MSEWWTYRPSDFLMFSPRTYQRLFELMNAATWPAPLLGLLAGLVVLALLARRRAGGTRARIAFALLALAWASVGLVFHARWFAPINWAATGFAAAFVAQALVWLALAVRPALQRVDRRRPRHHAGIVLVGIAVLGWPLLAPAFGRPWRQAELFGLAPDPTVLATFGVLLLHEMPSVALRLAAWTVPLLWLAWALLLQWTMASP
ncbi:DUF6064 family protein [Aquabacterium humicola]|uniref:DUF6064 family protein n=1 Tax=Aquabacterium humicola TaxID=3237377 RepID=UPI002542F4DB|nr:DUF6064 family protein [Rubrivivax pictus]